MSLRVFTAEWAGSHGPHPSVTTDLGVGPREHGPAMATCTPGPRAGSCTCASERGLQEERTGREGTEGAGWKGKGVRTSYLPLPLLSSLGPSFSFVATTPSLPPSPSPPLHLSAAVPAFAQLQGDQELGREGRPRHCLTAAWRAQRRTLLCGLLGERNAQKMLQMGPLLQRGPGPREPTSGSFQRNFEADEAVKVC